MIRLAHKAAAEPILGKGGKPVVYPTELAAQRAATDGLTAYINGRLTRDGETLSTGVMAAAEALFCKQKGREKRIPVERRARA